MPKAVLKSVLVVLVALLLPAAQAEDKPTAKPADAAQLQGTLIAVGHLSVHRPECVVAIVAAAARRGPLTSAEFRDLDLPVQGAVAATGIIGVKNALVDVALIRHAANNGFWIVDEPASVARRVREPDLDKAQLIGIEDGRKIPSYADNPDEYRSYIYVISYAHDVPVAALAKAANREITYAHLLEQPGKYRGDIVPISGHLKQLRKFDAPRALWNDGIRVMYEALIVSDAYYGNRYYVVLTEIPPTMKLGDNVDYPVTCDAYFFKRYFLENVKDGTRQRAPLLIGRTVVLQTTGAVTAPSDPMIFPGIPVVFVVIGLTLAAALVFCLLLWFRKGDRAVQSRLAGARNTKWVPPTEENGVAAEARRAAQGQEPPPN